MITEYIASLEFIVRYSCIMMNKYTQPLFVLVAIVFCSSLACAQSIIDASKFQAPKQSVYTLDEGDTLGVFVEGVVGEFNSMPPVHQPAPGSDLGPAIGFPTLVLHDGSIRLPLEEPIAVRGLTVAQVESLLKKIYREGDSPILTDRSRVIVSLIRKRTVNVVVVRSDQSQAQSDPRFARQGSRPVSARSDGSGRVYNMNLPVGDNDLLNAMMQSGGFPGVNAADQLQVLRNVPASNLQTSSFPRANSFPRTGNRQASRGLAQGFPIRTTASNAASPFPRSQTRLRNGDIVSISGKPTEVFYTGGQLGGGEFVIPRDRPLSVMDAIAQAGGIPRAQGTTGIPLQQPRVLTLLRRNGGRQVSMQFDVGSGFSQQASQTRVRSGDYLILDFSPAQRVQNVGVGAFNTFGIRQLLRN